MIADQSIDEGVLIYACFVYYTEGKEFILYIAIINVILNWKKVCFTDRRESLIPFRPKQRKLMCGLRLVTTF